jgi:ABC-type transport system substrate-binding protein
MHRKKLLLIVVAVMFLSSAFLVGCTNAVDDALTLPSSGTVVILEASNSTQAYFDSALSDVPDGYDVTNGTYLGWCIDRSAEMTRLTPHTVNLYSSFSPTGELASENWTMVNYVLNHKRLYGILLT